LNYVLPQLASDMRMAGYEDVQKIVCRVYPDDQPDEPDAPLPVYPGKSTAEALREYAQDIQDDNLREALMRLGEHLHPARHSGS